MSISSSRLLNSVAFRQALIYGALVVATMLVLLLVLHFQTVGVWQRRIDRQIDLTTDRLIARLNEKGIASLAARIGQILGDGVNSDTEVYLLIDSEGRKAAGNLAVLRELTQPRPGITEQRLMRAGRLSPTRLRISATSTGEVLVVGRDMQDQHELEYLIRRASLYGGIITLLMAVAGAFVFRRQLERRIGAIRQITARIEHGDLSQRITVGADEDEFARLGRDINAMLDRIHGLMDGVRHVSNTIAHNIRTPLTRILVRLRTAQAATDDPSLLVGATEFAIREIEDLNVVFNKLLQIAEVESGARRQSFIPVSLNAIAVDVLDLYDAVAEQKQSRLTHTFNGEPMVNGDPDLLASALANLVDNALKYTDAGAAIHLETRSEGPSVIITVQDDGPGVPAAERSRIGTRFLRLDRSVPGYGLGLASAIAIARLHGGNMQFEDARTGLLARFILPTLERS